MPIASHHIIRQQYLHVEVCGTESDGLSLERSLPGLCQHWLIPAIERALERCAPPEGHLCIERVEIDVGTLVLESLERDITDAVSQLLEKKLRKQILASEIATTNIFGNIQHKTAAHAIHEAFIYFLETGTLPWAFRLPQGSTLEQELLDSWQAVLRSSEHQRVIKERCLRELASATVRKRLIQQFSPVFLADLLSLLSPAGRKIIDEVLQLLRSAEGASGVIKQFEHLLWETVFAKVAAGNALSSLALVGATWYALPRTAEGQTALLNVLERHWPAVTCKIPEARSGIISKEVRSANDIEALPSNLVGSGSTPFRSSQEPEAGEARPVGDGAAIEKISNETRVSNNIKPMSATSVGSARSLLPRSQDLAIGEEGRPTGDGVAIEKVSKDTRSSKAIKPMLPNLVGSGSTPIRSSQDSEAGEGIGIEQVNDEMSSLKDAESIPPSHTSSIIPFNLSQHPEAGEGIFIDNAGLVLLHPFLPQFFMALGIAAGDKLLQPERALCLLYFLTTGQLIAPEYELVLPKIFCNVPLGAPVAADVALTTSEQGEAAALLQAVIRHWDVLRSTSPDGLRGTFLLRPGKVSLRNDDWLLQVESRTCDILLEQLPWGIAMIKLPWMANMVWVEWR